jgi:K+-transporting ATPase ATPase A chain
MISTITILIYLGSLILLAIPLGYYIANLFLETRSTRFSFLNHLEKWIFKIIPINYQREMTWKTYTFSLLMFSGIGGLFLFILQLFQEYIPGNPNHLTNVPWHLAFNTTISFITNTNWQSYSGESTMSYLVQSLGLTVQNFLSAAVGISVLVALIRGFKRSSTGTIGNFWIDLVRSTLFILLPLSILLTIPLVQQGTIQNFNPNQIIKTIEGADQVLPMGPAASQIAIKQLGTNGGGFFGVNSSHPFENPTPLTNLLQMIAILLIPVALVFSFGRLLNKPKEAKAIFMVMLFLLILSLSASLYSESVYNSTLNIEKSLEGKEVRFGTTSSVLWSTITTCASNGSVNAMHESMNPLSGLAQLVNMMLGEIIFGGVGSGLYGMILFIILTVFIAGLLVGRTPEYLGKKIESFEIRMTMIGVLIPGLAILVFSFIALARNNGLTELTNSGPHGLSSILYAYTSAAGNNGSAFAGLAANNPFYNITLGIAMLIGRFGVIIPTLAIAGSLASKKSIAASSGTLRTDSTLFNIILIGVIMIVGGLTFFPALSLGPIAETILMNQGLSF